MSQRDEKGSHGHGGSGSGSSWTLFSSEAVGDGKPKTVVHELVHAADESTADGAAENGGSQESDAVAALGSGDGMVSRADHSTNRLVADKKSHGKRGEGALRGEEGLLGQLGANGETVLASDSTVRGELFFVGPARIEGCVEGQVRAEATLIVGETAEVHAPIFAARAQVFGRVNGDIQCSERLELHAGARVEGNLTSPVIVIGDGAVFDGYCRMIPIDADSEL